MPKRLYITTILIGLLFYLPGIANSAVRTIYFVPNDRVPQNRIHSTIDTQMKAVQAFYKAQMEAHGYAERTFSLETDRTGKVITHTIIGNHSDNYYLQGTLDKVEAEIQNKFNNTGNDIYVTFVDLSDERVDGNCGIARYQGGPVLIPAHGDCIEGEGGIDLIAHELGHAFNLLHDFRDDTYIMSYGYGRNKLSECAAAFLSVSPYYNGRTPKVDKPATIQIVSGRQPPTTGDWTLRFTVSDLDGLFQVQFEHAFPNKPAGIIECQRIQGTSSTQVTLTMPAGAKLSPVNNIWVRVVDNNGNTHTQDWALNTEQAEPTENMTYLTLSYQTGNSIMPTNSKAQWDSWLGHIWEKTPDGRITQKPLYYLSHQYSDVWDNWFYAHAGSRIEYDINRLGNSRFDGWLYLAHPCSDNNPPASIEFIAYADDSKIYNSGMKNGNKPNDRNTHISFGIPENTETLTIEVSTGESGVCDHFVIGNARLIHEATENNTETIITTTPPVPTDSNETYLTLAYDSPDALIPTNPRGEWTTWGQLWEKTPDGLVPRTPNGVFPASVFNGEDWTHFFYGHAPSRIVYDISKANYKSFQTYFHMPNPCGNSIKVTFFADDTEIHNPGLLYIGRGTRIEFNIPEGTKTLTIKVDDLGDPSCDHFVFGEPTLTDQTLESKDPPNTLISTDNTKTLLTLTYETPSTLTPINSRGEWATWGQLWEKTPDGLVPRTPDGSFPANTFGGEDWTHFFYAHADSRIVWDISNKDYENFHAHFDMPNPCGNYAKLTVVFIADDTEIYNSGVLQGSEGRHSEITFDIPEGTEMLTLKVDDLGDPGCDHFVFGEPTLTHSVTTEPPVTTTPTTTTPTAMGNTTVSLLPISVPSPNIGQLLKLSVKITNGKNVAGYQATVQFDDTALRYVESSNSDYLPDGAFFVSPILEGNLVRLNAASLAGESNDDGTLATLTFEVIAVKASILTLSDVLLSNSTGETFAPQVENSQITEPTKLTGDVNSDGTVNIADLVLVASNLGQIGQNAADVNSDGVVNIADLVLVAGALGEGAAAAPTLHASGLERLTAAEVQDMLTQARQMALTDPAYLRGITVLEQLQALLPPKETALLPNYPNPFNPETWIPYQLAKPAEVTLHIYSVNGTLVRVLALGHQSAGQYQSRSRTAYWDGKNAFGEPVASGLYFYTLTAGDFTATRKMLIVK